MCLSRPLLHLPSLLQDLCLIFKSQIWNAYCIWVYVMVNHYLVNILLLLTEGDNKYVQDFLLSLGSLWRPLYENNHGKAFHCMPSGMNKKPWAYHGFLPWSKDGAKLLHRVLWFTFIEGGGKDQVYYMLGPLFSPFYLLVFLSCICILVLSERRRSFCIFIIIPWYAKLPLNYIYFPLLY